MNYVVCCHPQLEPGQDALAVVSDSSDRSREKNGDQKVKLFKFLALATCNKHFADSLCC
jgi:hypothetical protein